MIKRAVNKGILISQGSKMAEYLTVVLSEVVLI